MFLTCSSRKWLGYQFHSPALTLRRFIADSWLFNLISMPSSGLKNSLPFHHVFG